MVEDLLQKSSAGTSDAPSSQLLSERSLKPGSFSQSEALLSDATAEEHPTKETLGYILQEGAVSTPAARLSKAYMLTNCPGPFSLHW